MALFWGAALQSHATTLVISDVDDTLKASHSDNLKQSVIFAPAIENELKGMSDLFSLMRSIPDVKFLYLSAAPEIVMQDLHAEFLNINRFPKGKLKLKGVFEDSVEYKTAVIEKAIRKNKKIKNLILIGDNGQKDAFIYDSIAQKHSKKINVLQYIRQTYAPNVKKALKPFQTPFVSPIEICMGLSEEGFIKCSDLFLEQIIRNIEQEEVSSHFGSYYFHPYMNCQGYRWPYSYKDTPLFKRAGKLLEQKCSS